MAAGVEVGGWCPSGRWADDGPIDDRYPLLETPSAETAERTEWNVRDSDATLILTDQAEPGGGTGLAIDCALKLDRPVLVVAPSQSGAIDHVLKWLRWHEVSTLNIAGPRESEKAGIYREAKCFVSRLLSEWSWNRGPDPFRRSLTD